MSGGSSDSGVHMGRGGGVGHRLSPVGSGGGSSSLMPGDFDRGRRLSAPCGTGGLQVYGFPTHLDGELYIC